MRTKGKLAISVAMLMFALPGSTSAAGTPIHIAPNFDYAQTSGGCGPLSVTYSCAASLDAQIDGALDLNLEVGTLMQGQSPGITGTIGDLLLGVEREMPDVVARALIYTVTVHVENADATGDGTPTSANGEGYIYLTAYFTVNGGSDSYFDQQQLIDLRGVDAPTKVQNEDVFLRFVVGSGHSQVHTGSVSVELAASAYVSAGNYFSSTTEVLPKGSARVSLDATVTVTVEPIF